MYFAFKALLIIYFGTCELLLKLFNYENDNLS